MPVPAGVFVNCADHIAAHDHALLALSAQVPAVSQLRLAATPPGDSLPPPGGAGGPPPVAPGSLAALVQKLFVAQTALLLSEREQEAADINAVDDDEGGIWDLLAAVGGD